MVDRRTQPEDGRERSAAGRDLGEGPSARAHRPRARRPRPLPGSGIAPPGPPPQGVPEHGSPPARASALALGLALAVAAAACGPSDPAPERPRNLLLVLLDTTRADRLSCYGHVRETSPAIDALAERGVRFEEAHAQSSLTPVSAGSVLTGVRPYRHGIRSLFVVGEERLAASATPLAESLSAAGLATAGFVSAVPMSSRYGLDRGFETYGDRFGARDPAPCGNEYQRRADETTDLALEWLGRNGLDPFFLMVHWFDAHDANLVPPREFLASRVSFPLPADLDRPCALMGLPDSAKLELYDAEIAWMDAQLRRLLDRLERLGVLEETLVVVLADHGEGLGDHGVWTHGWLWREQLRVPLVMAGPGLPREAGGAVVASRVRLVDLAPTVLELFDLAPAGRLDGESLLPLLRGEGAGPREVYAEVHHAGDDRLRREPAMYTLATGAWKYVHRPRSGDHELYRVADDPDELRDLWEPGHPDGERLRRALGELGALDARSYAGADVPAEQREMLEDLGYFGGEEGSAGERADDGAGGD